MKKTERFREKEFYKSDNNDFFILPFTFHRITGEIEVLVNEFGDFLLVPSHTAYRIANRQPLNAELLADLYANFFIADQPIPSLIDVMATRYRTKKSFMNDFTSLHMIVLTLRCNQSCQYCQVSRVAESKSDFDITFETIDAVVHQIFHSPSPSITIEFQGGEPLLAFEKLRYTVERALEVNEQFEKQITFVLCTNATLFTDDILEFCKKNEILISSSLDGPEYLHNANRCFENENSYLRTLHGIKMARTALGHDRISALMTTSSQSLKYPVEIINCYIENGFSNIFLRPVSRYGFAIKNVSQNKYDIDEFLQFYKTGLNYIIDINKNGKFFTEDYTTIILRKILTPFPVGFVDLQSPAGMINSAVIYNYDGYVYASDESRMLAANGDYTFRLGHVDDSYHSIFYGEKAKMFSEYWFNECLPGCSDCGFKVYCGADPGYNYITQNGDYEGFRPTSDFCKKNMEIIRYIFELIESNPKEILPIFYSWINNSPAHPDIKS